MKKSSLLKKLKIRQILSFPSRIFRKSRLLRAKSSLGSFLIDSLRTSYVFLKRRIVVSIRNIKRYIKTLDESNEVRIRFAIYFLSFLALILISRILIISFFNFDKKTQKAETVYEREVQIFDRNGKILVKNAFSYDLYFRPIDMLDLKSELDKTMKIIPRIKPRYDKILSKMVEKRDKKNGIVLGQFAISDWERRSLLDAGVVGVFFEEKRSRYYVHSNLFSHLIGICDESGIGIAGVEKSIYNGNIKDEDGKVFLSLDVDVQRILHQELSNLMTQKEALGAAGMIADIKTGEVIAAVSLPDFNPNNKEGFAENMFSRFSSGVYEFGSIFKLINTALALKNKIPLNKVYDISQDIKFGSRSIGDMKRRLNSMTTEEIVMYSSNIGSGKIALEVGAHNQREFFYELGLANKVGLEIPENATPILPKKSLWRDITSVTLSYGHGIAVTQGNVLRAIISILNKGRFTDLTILLNKKDNSEYYGMSVIDEKNSRLMQRVMRNVVQFGAGQKAKSQFYDIGGKGGTAIKLDERGHYSKRKNMLSFVAAFPMNEPKYAIIISLDEPKWKDDVSRFSVTGGGILGGPMKEIIERLGFFAKIDKMNKSEKDEISLEGVLRQY